MGFIYARRFGIIEHMLFCDERRGSMCINTELEKDNWDATNSWSGYNYQGKIALFVVLKKINELISMEKMDEIEKYSVELEWLEDFSILYKGDDGVQYKTIHQVKAKDRHNITDYEDALVKLYYKIVNYKTIEYAYLHVCKSISYNEDEWNDKAKGLVLNCRQIKALQDNIISYKSSPMKKEEVEKIYTPGRKSDINKLVKEYNEKYFANKKITVSNVDEILDKILSDLQLQIEMSQNDVKDENIRKIELYSYPSGDVYCKLDEINDLIKAEIDNYWRNTGAEGWKCTDQGFCEMIFLCLQGLIDKHITQRHIQYSRITERRIGFELITEVLDSDDSVKRCEEYYLYNIKNKLLMMCGEYHDYCMDEWDSDAEREAYCKKCEVSAFYESISRMDEDKIRDLVHAINPNILKKIDNLNWAEYCVMDRYKNPFFKGLRDINSTFEKDRDYISYVGKDKKLNLLTTVGNDGSKKALMRVCGEIVANPVLNEILMDVNCMISEGLEADSIYEMAGDFMTKFKIQEENIYHCKNVKMKPLERAIVDIDGGMEG